ncbi:MAG: TPM domain-containing protein [Bacteroidia bacterium]
MPQNFLSEAEQQQIIAAIQLAEKNTSGEIRVHMEPHCKKDSYERAQEVFVQLKMHETALKNGVLFYVAYEDHKIAVIGDKGIHDKVHDNFWAAELTLLTEHFKQGAYADGLSKAIAAAGEKLKEYFPYTDSDSDELSNDISFGGKHE